MGKRRQMTGTEADGMATTEDSIIAEALQAYGIPEQYCFASNFNSDTGIVTIVTHGGKKVRWFEGCEVERQLSEIEVAGINPENARRKPITGGGRKK
ncbi:MAG: hypothetical protein AB9866_10925 [Syntrophobacteraceae bacterium]